MSADIHEFFPSGFIHSSFSFILIVETASLRNDRLEDMVDHVGFGLVGWRS